MRTIGELKEAVVNVNVKGIMESWEYNKELSSTIKALVKLTKDWFIVKNRELSYKEMLNYIEEEILWGKKLNSFEKDLYNIYYLQYVSDTKI